MRMTIVCVGRARAAAEQDLCESYLKRARELGRRLGLSPIELIVVDTSRAPDAKARRAEEATRLRKRIPSGARRIVLDERASAPNSTGLAARLAALRDSGERELVFLIGGPDGLAPDFIEEAEERLSLGPQTWPHLLVRAMLAEQIYRALTILAGHPYHRGG
jgi:23S rRNA (pseudouridine1915-N3)-methyltransferase